MADRDELGQVGFDRAMTGIHIISMGTGEAQVGLPVGPDVLNPVGTLHGGAIATLVDDAGTVAIMSADRNNRPGVTTDLNVSYLRPAKAGAEVVAKAKVLKIGRTLGFVEVDITSGDQLVAQGRMTKFMGAQPDSRPVR